MTRTRAIPIHLAETDISEIDALATELRLSRSALLRACIALGVARVRPTPSIINDVLPAPTFNRGRPRKTRRTSESAAAATVNAGANLDAK